MPIFHLINSYVYLGLIPDFLFYSCTHCPILLIALQQVSGCTSVIIWYGKGMIHSFLTQSLPFCEVKFAYFIYLFIHSTHAAIYLLVKHLLNSFLIPGIIPAPERKR